MNIAIVGATGNVGRKIIEVLEQKKLPIKNLYLLASKKSSGLELVFNSRKIKVENLESFDFSKVEITFFSAGKIISQNYALKAADHSTVIDNSSFFRMDPDVPLIVPQVNKQKLSKLKKNIIANPNCSTSQMVIVLKPLHDLFEIKNGYVTTLHPLLSYQNLLDGPSSSWSVPGDIYHHYAVGRSSVGTLIPKPTSAVEAISRVLPHAAKNLKCMSTLRITKLLINLERTLLLLHFLKTV